jgi:hypothetical protein
MLGGAGYYRGTTILLTGTAGTGGYTKLTPANIAAAIVIAIRLNELESRLVMSDALASDA